MKRNTRIAKELVRIARMLVADDIEECKEIIENGSHVSQGERDEAMALINRIVEESGDSNAKNILDSIVNGGVRGSSRRMVAFDLIEKMKGIANSKLMYALFAAAVLWGAVPQVQAEEALGFGDRQIVESIKQIKEPDQKFAQEIADRTFKLGAGQVVMEEKDGVVYIGVSFNVPSMFQLRRMAFDRAGMTARFELAKKYGDSLVLRGFDFSGAKCEKDGVKAVTFTVNAPVQK